MSPNNKKKLITLRKKLDLLDNQLIKILKKRFNVVQNVLELKEKKSEIIEAKLISNQKAIVAGLSFAKHTFNQVDKKIKFIVKMFLFKNCVFHLFFKKFYFEIILSTSVFIFFIVFFDSLRLAILGPNGLKIFILIIL